MWQCGECLRNYSLDEKTVNEQTAQRSHKNASQPGPGTVEPKPDPEQEAELIRKRQREARQREQEAEQRRKEAQERELELYRLQAEQRWRQEAAAQSIDVSQSNEVVQSPNEDKAELLNQVQSLTRRGKLSRSIGNPRPPYM